MCDPENLPEDPEVELPVEEDDVTTESLDSGGNGAGSGGPGR